MCCVQMSNNVNMYMSFFLRMVGNLYSFIYGQVKCIVVKLSFFFLKYSITEKVYYWKLQNLIPADFIATPVSRKSSYHEKGSNVTTDNS